MFKTIKNIILVDETQPLEQIKQQFKSRTYWFLGLSWLISFLLIWIIPQDIMRHDWAKGFVEFMGYIVPMVDGLEHIRLHGSSDPYKAHLTVLPHISFYYAVLWAYAWICVPYMIILVKGNFKYNKDSDLIGIKILIKRYNYKKFWYYFGIIAVIIIIIPFSYIVSDVGSHWFKVKYIYNFLAGSLSSVFTLHMLFITISFLYTHFLIKQQEKQHTNY